MNVLITGGAGFVGRHFVLSCVRGGHKVTVVDSLIESGGGIAPESWPAGLASCVGEFHFFQEDCRAFFARHSPHSFDLILHLAAVVGGRLTIENQALAVADDLSIDASIFGWLAQGFAGRLVFFSSSAAYPVEYQTEQDSRVLEEDMIDFETRIGVPDLSYGWSKLTGEYLGRLAEERYGLSVPIYRPFSGYGEDQDLTYPFPALVKRMMDTHPGSDFVVWGSGNQSRDFIHIDDCVEIVMSSLDSVTARKPLNLSTGMATTFANLAREIASQLGRDDLIIKADQTKPEGVYCRVGSRSRQDSLVSETRIPLSVGVRRAIEALS
jgi:nucleoside-diphosphate-sugar epimerase